MKFHHGRTMPTLLPVAERAFNAYGGASVWKKNSAVEIIFSAWGWAFRLKWRRAFRRARARLAISRPETRIVPIDGAGNTGVLEGHDVRIEDHAGNVLAQRANAQEFFRSRRRLFRWDDLDQLYFAGYAMWNYMTLPFLLRREDVDWREIGPTSLEACFPAHLPTHCERQQFHFDRNSGLLRQHDYTADVIGAWAKAAHVIVEHGDQEGTPYTSKRRVTPRRRDGRPRIGPLLIGIEIHDWRVV